MALYGQANRNEYANCDTNAFVMKELTVKLEKLNLKKFKKMNVKDIKLRSTKIPMKKCTVQLEKLTLKKLKEMNLKVTSTKNPCVVKFGVIAKLQIRFVKQYFKDWKITLDDIRKFCCIKKLTVSFYFYVLNFIFQRLKQTGLFYCVKRLLEVEDLSMCRRVTDNYRKLQQFTDNLKNVYDRYKYVLETDGTARLMRKRLEIYCSKSSLGFGKIEETKLAHNGKNRASKVANQEKGEEKTEKEYKDTERENAGSIDFKDNNFSSANRAEMFSTFTPVKLGKRKSETNVCVKSNKRGKIIRGNELKTVFSSNESEIGERSKPQEKSNELMSSDSIVPESMFSSIENTIPEDSRTHIENKSTDVTIMIEKSTAIEEFDASIAIKMNEKIYDGMPKEQKSSTVHEKVSRKRKQIAGKSTKTNEVTPRKKILLSPSSEISNANEECEDENKNIYIEEKNIGEKECKTDSLSHKVEGDGVPTTPKENREESVKTAHAVKSSEKSDISVCDDDITNPINVEDEWNNFNSKDYVDSEYLLLASIWSR